MKQLSRTIGVVQGMSLTFQQDGGGVTVEVGSAAWFQWLEQATAFTFRDEAGQFTAQKTHAGNQRGGSYWRARRRSQGRLTSYYLGPSARRTRSRRVSAMIPRRGKQRRRGHTPPPGTASPFRAPAWHHHPPRRGR